MLQVITCYFNPCGYENLRRNYTRFRDNLNCDLVTVELSFDGSFFVPDAIQIRGTERNLLWQKERLLNVALEHLDPQCDKVAWIDADVLFLNPGWAEDAGRLLDHLPLVQLFEEIHDVDHRGRIGRRSYSWAKVNTDPRLKGKYGRPGLAWAARREILTDGFYDAHVLGGGDAAMLYAWTGVAKFPGVLPRDSAWESHYCDWAYPQFLKVQGNVGCVTGHAVHLFHGSWHNRKYTERYAVLNENDFNPLDDIRIENGIWAWCSDKPKLHRGVAEYFRGRKEDQD